MAKFTEHYYEIRAGMLRRYSYSPMTQTVHVLSVAVHEHYDRIGEYKFMRMISIELIV